MSERNAYDIFVTKTDGYKYNYLRQRLDNLFSGYVEEIEGGLRAQDSPGVDSVFPDGPAYVRADELISILNEPIFSDWSDENWLDAREDYDELADLDQPGDAGAYVDIVERVVHRYANDTSCVREENELDI